MENKELALNLSNELKEFPVFTQNIVKTALQELQKEVKEGKILLAELFESEEKFIGTLAEIIDIETNTGLLDPVDYPIIKKAVQLIVVGLLKKAFGEDWLDDLRKFIS